ncbi:hypothetical protein [Streptomyces roseochromogenus]|uniref:Uncharacterized protein n=1 Tax=Streptomyces roseochromogenus subsp. oscitans DS 12.976 TaxID=1352936 RepID=V6KWM9_STRRC|nr:hypothetical protein [Streptomyces roseochromogenus]EST33389.1 hypothetical protein M878_12785 [Streptomyces roseochromogenus subsp. oscitans DS 12.976]
MATKTEEGAEARNDEKTAVEAVGAEEEAAEAEAGEESPESEGTLEPEENLEPDGDAADPDAKVPSGVGQGAGAVVSAALGLVSLSGGWIGTVAGAREQLVGQLRTSSTASVATQIKAVYGNAWHSTALWAGLFALAALLTGVVVLARPAFGAPGRPQAPWIKSVAWAGVCLGAVGLLLAVLKYSDALLALPSTG